MIIIGIDPGYAITGYGVVEYKDNHFKVLDFGVISTSSHSSFPLRLLAVAQGIDQLILKHRPDAMAVEELFFARNTTTALGTAQARGVAILSGAKSHINVYEYTPLQVKIAVSGYGRAEKKQIQQMVKIILNLKDIAKPDDASDALAVAICHAHTGNIGSNLAKGGNY